MMSLVENIRSYCKLANTSLPKLEKHLGFGNGAIYNWDKNSPSIEKLQKVANYFKVSIDELLGRGDIYEIGWAIKEEREIQGISLEELAKEININQDLISQYEDDGLPIPSDLAEKIVNLFGMTFPSFLEKYHMYDGYIHSHFNGDADAHEKFKPAVDRDALSESSRGIETIVAHHDGEEWTEDELKEIELFKEFVKSKRSHQE